MRHEIESNELQDVDFYDAVNPYYEQLTRACVNGCGCRHCSRRRVALTISLRELERNYLEENKRRILFDNGSSCFHSAAASVVGLARCLNVNHFLRGGVRFPLVLDPRLIQLHCVAKTLGGNDSGDSFVLTANGGLKSVNHDFFRCHLLENHNDTGQGPRSWADVISLFIKDPERKIEVVCLIAPPWPRRIIT